MFERDVDLSLLAYSVSALAHTLFLFAYVWRNGRATIGPPLAAKIFLAAVVSGLGWSVVGLLAQTEESPMLSLLALPLADVIRYGLLLWFVLSLLKPTELDAPALVRKILPLVTVLSIGLSLGFVLGREYAPFSYSSWLRPLAFSWMLMSVLGMVLVEQLLRNTASDDRWSVKPVFLGLGAVFLFDLYLFSQAALFQQFDADAAGVRPLVHALSVPFLWVASRRRADWISKLHVSRAAAFHSATMLLAGGYLLLVSGVGYYIRYSGGDWGRAMQIAIVSMALLALILVMLSGAMRARLRVYISKHFFSYRYDYRDEWLKFTAMLASQQSPQALGESVIKGLANLLESPAGALWLRRGGDDAFSQLTNWNFPATAIKLSAAAPVVEFMERTGWIVDLDEFRAGSKSYEGVIVPEWLMQDAKYWLLIPLLVRGGLVGLVVLGPPRVKMDVNWEVRDLLRTASSQAAGYLAQMQATEALLEAKKFDAFNKMSAFVVHDLKNIVTQLSLMMKNARRLRDNPEFQEDMLSTVENSLEKMRQLMLQLREGSSPHGLARNLDLADIAERLAAAAHSKGRDLELDVRTRVNTRGHLDRIERVIGHMVQNAFDATPDSGRVWLTVDRAGSYASLVIGDTGCGMSDEFVKTRLFKPFHTTKTAGMGIGAYESFQYLQEIGGKIQVESEVNQGTTITVLLPLLHVDDNVGANVVAAT